MLGADESLRDTVTQLWCRYLKTCRQAFVEPSKRRVVGYRNTVVSVYPERRRVFGMNVVAKKIKAAKTSKKRGRGAGLDSDADDHSAAARRARARKRRKYLESVGGGSDVTSEANEQSLISGSEGPITSDSNWDSDGGSSLFGGDSTSGDSFNLSLSSFSVASRGNHQALFLNTFNATIRISEN